MKKNTYFARSLISLGILLIAAPSALFAPKHAQRKTGNIFNALKQPSNSFIVAQNTIPLQFDTASPMTPVDFNQEKDEKPPVTLPEQEDAKKIIGQATVPKEATRGEKERIERPAFMDDTFRLPLEFQRAEEMQQNEVKEAEKTLEKLTPLDEEERVEFNFENADLQNFVRQIEDIFDVTFIADEAITPLPQGSLPIAGHKITFHTNTPLSRTEAWSLFITFMQIAGHSVVQTPKKNIYRLQPIEAARRSAVPAFIGVDYSILPDSDEIVRYVYFIQNSTVEAIQEMVDKLRSSSSSLVVLRENKAFVLTDKSYNIKTLMKIVKELDQVSMPQSMSILKLRRADAMQVKALYDSLIQANNPQGAQMPNRARPRAKPTALFFPENTLIIAEPRTNSLILLGAKDDIVKIEEFIIKYVDIDLDQPPSPLHVYQLQFADATTVADIMNQVTQFGKQTPAGQAGGVRGIDKYLKPISFVAEKATNRLVIKGDYEDYMRSRTIIQKLDEPQPQVAIEVLIISINVNDQRQLGVQIRNKLNGLDGFAGPNIAFQTSGLRAGGTPQGIVENPTGPGVTRLLGNLLNLVTGAGPANTIITLGQDALGVWGILQFLQSMTSLQVISNPFLIATNNTKAEVAVGETRRVITGTIVGSSSDVESRGDDDAQLKVTITPQINSDGMIILTLRVEITDFTDKVNLSSGNKLSRVIDTKTIVADKEVLALGGLIRNTIENSLSKTPLLGDIPVIGWLFKNKQKNERKDNLIILLSTRIIRPDATADINAYTQNRIADYQGTLKSMQDTSEKRDPIHRVFFRDAYAADREVDELIFKRRTEDPIKESPAQKRRRIRKERIAARKKQKEFAQEAADQSVSSSLEVKNTAPAHMPKTAVSGAISLVDNWQTIPKPEVPPITNPRQSKSGGQA